MLNKLLAGILCFTLAGCSEPAESPVTQQQPDDSGVYPQVMTTSSDTILTLWVAAEKRECMAVGPTECMQIRLDPNQDWQLFYGEIIGFDYQPGLVYQIEVDEVMIPEPAADAPDRQWILRQVISSYNE